MGTTHFASSGGKAVLPLPGVNPKPAPLGSDIYPSFPKNLEDTPLETVTSDETLTNVMEKYTNWLTAKCDKEGDRTDDQVLTKPEVISANVDQSVNQDVSTK